MKIKSILKIVTVVIMVITTVLLILPASTNADLLPGCTFTGLVTLNGNNIPAGSLVSGWITGISTIWQATTGYDSVFSLYIPPNTGGENKNGGVNGDIVHFSVVINGVSVFDPTTEKYKSFGFILHPMRITGVLTPLSITTNALPTATQNATYSCIVEATGGVLNYYWSATGLPTGLNISTSNNKGIISGTPTVSGNYSVAVTVTDSSIPANTNTKTLMLQVLPWVEFHIITTELNRWPVEVYPANPSDSWGALPKPGWIINQPYTSTMQATSGYGPIIWSAVNLPPGLAISTQGIMSGSPTTAGVYNIVFTGADSANIQNFHNITLTLQIYNAGDADGNGSRAVNDVTFLNRVILGLEAPRAGCDANLSQTITIADVTKLERLLAGITK